MKTRKKAKKPTLAQVRKDLDAIQRRIDLAERRGNAIQWYIDQLEKKQDRLLFGS